MGELVLNPVEGKEFFTIKTVYSPIDPQYSIPVLHYNDINRFSLKSYYFQNFIELPTG